MLGMQSCQRISACCHYLFKSSSDTLAAPALSREGGSIRKGKKKNTTGFCCTPSNAGMQPDEKISLYLTNPNDDLIMKVHIWISVITPPRSADYYSEGFRILKTDFGTTLESEMIFFSLNVSIKATLQHINICSIFPLTCW